MTTYSPDIRFRILSYAIEGSLQLGVKALGLGFVGVGWNKYLPGDTCQSPRKRFGNHERVPGVQDPGIFNRGVKRGQRHSGSAGQQHRAGLGDVAWPARSVDGKYGSPPLLDVPPHAQQCADGAAITGATHWHESKLPDDSRDVFAVEALAGHHADLAVAPHKRRCKNAPVPKRVDQGAGFEIRNCAFFARHGITQGRPDQSDCKICRPGDEPDHDSLAQRVAGDRRVGSNRRGKRCAHELIVKGRTACAAMG